MNFPSCFVPKCAECECRAICAKVVWQGKPPVQPVVQPVVQPKERRRRRAGKKIKDMTHEEKKAYWREYAARKRDSKKKEEAGEGISEDEKFERMQLLQDKIDKTKEDLNGIVPERP